VHPVPLRTFALAGPGRVGTSLALSLAVHGWRPVGVAGRRIDAPWTRAAVARLGCPPRTAAELGRGAGLVVIATHDRDIDAVVAEMAAGLERGSLVVHCSGARGLEALAPIVATRPDVAIGALHPLQTFPNVDSTRLAGAWAAVAGPASVTELALELGLHPFAVPDERRAAYHAAAVVASNHLVALLGQLSRLAQAVEVPLEAFQPLVRATIANVEARGPRAALTGPVARGDIGTVTAHLGAIDARDRDAYAALALAALDLCGRDDPELRAVLDRARGSVFA
jgi:predicted short-subunit dehydrogenase-like oxidoreductase (DUF2520 family)